jgi:hypothetical protein
MIDDEQRYEDKRFAAAMRQFFPGVPIPHDRDAAADPDPDVETGAVDAHIAHFFRAAQPRRRRPMPPTRSGHND